MLRKIADIFSHRVAPNPAGKWPYQFCPAWLGRLRFTFGVGATAGRDSASPHGGRSSGQRCARWEEEPPSLWWAEGSESQIAHYTSLPIPTHQLNPGVKEVIGFLAYVLSKFTLNRQPRGVPAIALRLQLDQKASIDVSVFGLSSGTPFNVNPMP